MTNILSFVNEFTSLVSNTTSYLLIFILIGTGIFITISLKFIQLFKLKHSLAVISGKYDNPDDQGDVSHFQALSAALSATVGIGNIAGVALALRLGGPGALFWMWITAFFGMALKYAECTLAHKYRVILEDGSASGGPMYYIEKGLGKSWKPLAIFFAACAVICSFCTGNMNQSNSLAAVFAGYGISTWVSGFIIASLVGIVIIGGIKRIALVASRLVPTMAGLYIFSVLIILFLNIDKLLPALTLIFTKAFSLEAGIGGLFTVIMWGIRRGLFSNEAGQGSAPIAHAAAKTKESAREGTVALIGPFLDTIIICTMTGLAILTTGVLTSTSLTGAQLTQKAFELGIPFAPNFAAFLVSFAVLLFGFTTAVAWSYYGNRSIVYLFGPKYVQLYNYVYIVFIFLGAILPLEFVWNFGDIALSLMSIPNLIAVILLTGVVREVSQKYFQNH